VAQKFKAPAGVSVSPIHKSSLSTQSNNYSVPKMAEESREEGILRETNQVGRPS
jgi:hypothetical protein